MKEDLKTNLYMSQVATDNATLLKEKYGFSDTKSVLQLALAYAILHHKDEIDFDRLDQEYPGDGSNYNIGTLDDEELTIRKTILATYPECTTPNRYYRVLCIYGIERIFERLNSDQSNLLEIL